MIKKGKHYKTCNGDIYLIRAATIKDLGEIAKVHSSSALLAYKGFSERIPSLNNIFAEETLHTSWGEYLALSAVDDSFVGIVAEKVSLNKSEIVGVAKAKVLTNYYSDIFKQATGNELSCDEAKNYANLQTIYIDPKHQRQGIGRFMMSYFAEYYKEKGCKKAITETLNGYNVSPKFFDSVGEARLLGVYHDEAFRSVNNDASKQSEVLSFCLWEMADINKMVVASYLQSQKIKYAKNNNILAKGRNR